MSILVIRVCEAVFGDEDWFVIRFVKLLEGAHEILWLHIPAEIVYSFIRVVDAIAINPVTEIIIHADEITLFDDAPEKPIVVTALLELSAPHAEPSIVTGINIAIIFCDRDFVATAFCVNHRRRLVVCFDEIALDGLGEALA